MTQRESIYNVVSNLRTHELVALWHGVCDDHNYPDSEVYDMESLNELLSGRSPDWILDRAFYGKFNPCHSYFWFNGYGNLESADYCEDMPIDFSEITDYIVEGGDNGDFIDNEMLEADFIDFAKTEYNVETTLEEIEDKIGYCPDLITDDWDKVLKEFTE